MATFLDIKTDVTEQLGSLDANTYVAKRETCINRARRRYYSENAWYYLGVNDYSLAFTAGVAPLPTNFNKKFDPEDVYYYSGNIKYAFNKVDWGSIPSYLQDQYVYAIDKTAGSIKTNHPEIAALTMSYTMLPSDYTATDGSQDTSVEAAPDITAIVFLAIAYWWLSKERNDDLYKLFLAQYKDKLKDDMTQDEATTPVRFFRPLRPYIIRGYVSKQ